MAVVEKRGRDQYLVHLKQVKLGTEYVNEMLSFWKGRYLAEKVDRKPAALEAAIGEIVTL